MKLKALYTNKDGWIQVPESFITLRELFLDVIKNPLTTIGEIETVVQNVDIPVYIHNGKLEIVKSNE